MPPTFGLPDVKMPQMNEEDAAELAKTEARRLKPYNDWVEVCLSVLFRIII